MSAEEPEKNYWKQLDAKQRGTIASLFAKIDVIKALLIVLVTTGLLAQPLWKSYYENQSKERDAEITKATKASESSLAISQAAISQLTALSGQQGELRAENQSLRRELELLKAENLSLRQELSSLSDKYKTLENDYVQTLEQKKALENRIDELFKKHTNDKKD